MERDIVQHVVAGAVAEMDVLELDVARDRWWCDSIGAIADVGGGIEQLEDRARRADSGCDRGSRR